MIVRLGWVALASRQCLHRITAKCPDGWAGACTPAACLRLALLSLPLRQATGRHRDGLCGGQGDELQGTRSDRRRTELGECEVGPRLEKIKDLGYHWWVREEYIIIVGVVGDCIALSVLQNLLQGEPKDRCTYYAINAITRLTKKDVRTSPLKRWTSRKPGGECSTCFGMASKHPQPPRPPGWMGSDCQAWSA